MNNQKCNQKCTNSCKTFFTDGERIWAGVDNVYGGMSTMLEPIPTAKGSLCYYKSKEGEDKWREVETFK